MELISVVFSSALVFVAVVVQHIGNVSRRGVSYVMSSRSEPAPTDGFSGRAARTLQNNLESCAMYAPVAIAIVILQRESTITYYAALIYMLARAVFAFCYWLKVEGLRSMAWLGGMICTATMFARLLI
jgi:uncharacterized MAPEG superfamily protein